MNAALTCKLERNSLQVKKAAEEYLRVKKVPQLFKVSNICPHVLLKNRNISFKLLLVLLLALGCGPTRDNFFNRRYQNLLARDNAYFNARLKLADAVKTLAAANVDDHTRVIDVYPYGTEKDGKTLLPAMDEVYKKCSNVIQKRPISKWIDDCLVAKTLLPEEDYEVTGAILFLCSFLFSFF